MPARPSNRATSGPSRERATSAAFWAFSALSSLVTLPSGPGVHVDDHRRDAGVLGRLGVGSHGGQPAMAELGATRPDLLAVDQPAALDPGAAGADAGSVRPGVGLAEQLAPHFVAGQRRPH